MPTHTHLGLRLVVYLYQSSLKQLLILFTVHALGIIYFVFLVILYFSLEGRTLTLIVSVPGHILYFSLSLILTQLRWTDRLIVYLSALYALVH